MIKEFRRLGIWNPEPRSVLDAGGGKGAFAYYVARKFPSWRVVMADNDPEAIERGERIKGALRLTNLEVREADLRDADQEWTYDVIVCSDVLEHIEEDCLVMKNLARALKPGGLVVVTSPSVPQPNHLPLVTWRERRIRFRVSEYGHVRQGYSHGDLWRVMQNAGLEVDRIRWTFGRFGTLMFDLFFFTGDSRPNPVVYAVLFPLYMALSLLDVAFPVRHGAGILGVGRKP